MKRRSLFKKTLALAGGALALPFLPNHVEAPPVVAEADSLTEADLAAWMANYQHQEMALSIRITTAALEDDVYGMYERLAAS